MARSPSDRSPDGELPRPVRGAVTERPVLRVGRGTSEPATDVVVVEAPLQVQISGEPLATTMRTPGRDRDLVLGFLLSEGLIDQLDDVGRISHCGRPGDAGYGNVIDVLPGAGFAFDPERVRAAQRDAHAGCGVCGREAIDDLMRRSSVVVPPRVLPRGLIFAAHDALRRNQADFHATGGSHAAAALASGGQCLAHAEDVGRHNAVDKVLGQLLFAGRLGPGKDDAAIIAVSGRASFELVHKAVIASCTVLTSVSAPSSLAIDLAAAAGLCLAGFARGDHCNLYCHGEHIEPEGSNDAS